MSDKDKTMQQAEPVAIQEKSCARCLHKPTWPNTSGVCGGCRFYSNFRATLPLPVQRQPLTDEQIKVIHFDLCNTVGSDYKTVARAIEAAHNIGAKP